MVTRTVICVTPSEAAALAAAESWSSAAADSIIKNASNSTTHATKNGNDINENCGEKKRALPSGDPIISGREMKKCKRADGFVIDLSDVPPQLPIPRSKGRIMKEGSSKYAGITFDKANKKWRAQIMIDGKNRHIGLYENEEEAAIDYARASLKYKGQKAPYKAWVRTSSGPAIASAPAIDLSDVPPQPPIRRMKEGASKYAGVYLLANNTWTAQISIEGKQRYIGCYQSEEEAAVDYARAVFKYRGAKEQYKW